MKKRQNQYLLPSTGVETELFDFAVSMIKAERIDGKPDNLPAGWIEGALIKDGRIGWLFAENEAEGFYHIHRLGPVDRYGMPETAVLTTDATGGRQFSAPIVRGVGERQGKVAIMRANQSTRPPLLTIRKYARMIEACDEAILANIRASLRSQIIAVDNADLIDTVEIILEKGRQGLPAVIPGDIMAQIKTADISVDFNAPELQQLRVTLWSEAIKRFGGITPAQYKAERTQSAEVSATIAGSIDSVYMLIDQANADAEAQGIPYRLKYVGFGAKYDEEGGENG